MTTHFVAASPYGERPVKVISMQMDCFYFKVAKELVGDEVTVYSSKGEKLISETIIERKTLLDLYYLHSGVYKIVIVHNGVEYAFGYQKKHDVPFDSANGEGMSMSSVAQPHRRASRALVNPHHKDQFLPSFDLLNTTIASN